MLWAVDQPASPLSEAAGRERVLPGPGMHIAIRLGDRPIRIFGRIDDSQGQTLGYAVIGGPRAAFYVRDVSQPIRTVGAQIDSVAARIVFGIPAGEFAGSHTPLEEVWGPSAGRLRSQMSETNSLAERIRLLEAALLAHMGDVKRVHPAVAHALKRLSGALTVRDVVRETGYSQRRFIALFREESGLTPKVFCRLLRFQRILSQSIAHPATTWSELAYDASYSDQAHFNREFREFTGVTPGEYRLLSSQSPSHIPVLR
jgi:AraC-like DNA-binding protein